MLHKMLDWLEARSGAGGLVRGFFNEEIPASSGWPQVFGSVAVFLFLTQALTGILLAFNFAPVAGEAHNSLKYIVTEVTGGRIIRGLHHWGASMMVIVVVLHMAQVFLFGAYKRPREVTWMVGVCLFLVTLAFGLTGYLLPWDNRAYWGTIVSTHIAGQAPVMGPYLSRLLGSNGSIGVLTYSRFYALHAQLLPLATLLLIVMHVWLVRKHGVTPAPDDTAPKVKFYPRQVFKDTAAIFAAFAVVFLLAVLADVPLGRLADPTDSSFVPRPDWYFLFLFQMLKLFEGPLELFGTFVLPGLAVLTLFAVPFLDRGRVLRVTQRTTAFAAVGLAFLCWSGLTAAAIASNQAATVSAGQEQTESAGGWQQLSPEELAGISYFRKESCASCHNLGAGPRKVGPDLGLTHPRRSAGWMIEHFKRPGQIIPGSPMPAIGLADAQLNALAAFLLKLQPENAVALAAAPDFAVEGAVVYQASLCGSCHVVNGVGTQFGPPLNGVATRHDAEWLQKHFEDPRSVSPGSMMPPYHFSRQQMTRIVSYLMSLR